MCTGRPRTVREGVVSERNRTNLLAPLVLSGVPWCSQTGGLGYQARLAVVPRSWTTRPRRGQGVRGDQEAEVWAGSVPPSNPCPQASGQYRAKGSVAEPPIHSPAFLVLEKTM